MKNEGYLSVSRGRYNVGCMKRPAVRWTLIVRIRRFGASKPENFSFVTLAVDHDALGGERAP